MVNFESRLIHLLFDIDGTLIRNNTASNIAFRETINVLYGIKSFNDDWFSYYNDSDIGIIKEITKQNGVILSQKDICIFEKKYYEIFKKRIQDFPIEEVEGAQAFLKDVVSSKIFDVKIFSGGFPLISKEKLKMINIDETLLVASAYDGDNRNNIFSSIYNSAKDNIILFGDSISDINISKKNGIKLIGILSVENMDLFVKYDIKHVIKNYIGLRKEILIDYVNN